MHKTNSNTSIPLIKQLSKSLFHNFYIRFLQYPHHFPRKSLYQSGLAMIIRNGEMFRIRVFGVFFKGYALVYFEDC